ncbi:MFS general substrate transporter [Coniophora puteana RWD-64-598 SS2]|uniref:MFS general substrate transporter n=1 Tax=Coniophora puteana (strain RWD-64-598) TaxID=741705 RepID=A0A5M3MDC8_CONPW|nr:MFS general substrate transporter [Coniophora puteana RWD-64-598 SS2]EIW77228.1 MFS general substrate transporter [Coniophora puteana RWD-64-598 SS2]
MAMEMSNLNAAAAGSRDEVTEDQISCTLEVRPDAVEAGSNSHSTQCTFREVDGHKIVQWAPDDPECPFNWSLSKKCWVVGINCLQIIWTAMLSAIYASAVSGVARDLHVSTIVARIPQATFLLGFSVGPVIFTPLAEDYGRKPVYTVCIVVLYVLQIPQALTHSIAELIVLRFISGCFASPLLNGVATIPDLFTEDDPRQGYAVNVWAHCAEIIYLATLIGGYINAALGWRWIFWISAIVGGSLAVPYILFVPETRSGALLAARARRLRKETGDQSIRALSELQRRTWRDILVESLIRPVKMLFTEPAVLLFGFWDGLSYGLVFVLFQAFPPIYALHGFDETKSGLLFIAPYIGVWIAMFCYPLQLRAEERAMIKRGEKDPEASLKWGLVAAVMFPVAMWWFAWTIQPSIPWVVSIIANMILGFTGHIIFIVASVYVIEGYGVYASSAVSGQSFLREAMSASLSVVGATFYEKVGHSQASSILAVIATLMMPMPFVFYKYGKQIRLKSSFLQELLRNKKDE